MESSEKRRGLDSTGVELTRKQHRPRLQRCRRFADCRPSIPLRKVVKVENSLSCVLSYVAMPNSLLMNFTWAATSPWPAFLTLLVLIMSIRLNATVPVQLEIEQAFPNQDNGANAMKKQRKHYAPEEKVAILRRHLLEQVPISESCDKHGLQPTVCYRWQKEFFEYETGVFQSKPSRNESTTLRRRSRPKMRPWPN